MKKTINCPNCGSPIQEDQCRFCGSVFLDWSTIDFDKPVFIKFKKNGRVFRAKCRLREFSINNPSEPQSLYFADKVSYIVRNEPPEIKLSLDVVPVENINFVLIEEDKVNPEDLKQLWEKGKEP